MHVFVDEFNPSYQLILFWFVGVALAICWKIISIEIDTFTFLCLWSPCIHYVANKKHSPLSSFVSMFYPGVLPHNHIKSCFLSADIFYTIIPTSPIVGLGSWMGCNMFENPVFN